MLTAEEIAEKHKKAEERRQEQLEEKIQKAKSSQGKESDSKVSSPNDSISCSNLRTILLLAEELSQLILKCSFTVIYHVISSENPKKAQCAHDNVNTSNLISDFNNEL